MLGFCEDCFVPCLHTYLTKGQGESPPKEESVPWTGSVCARTCACVCVLVYSTVEDAYTDSVTLSKLFGPF